ncbi:MAG: hypothetical protein KAR24_02005 [Candidatus Pacebacteria bacterium]|nr:hypothetical protein [Candidatus Paceibacterota bacterium]MCK5590336.1 hypothetical protein [Candidatus Paceibacterota bacterium]
MNYFEHKKGFGLVEIVISVAIVGTVFSSFFFFYRQALILSQKTTTLVQTNMLLVEGVEVVKFLRDDSWNTNLLTLATGTPHYLLFTSGDWEVAAVSSAPIDGIYTRWFELDDVYRDGNDDIAVSGTYDPGTLKLTMYIDARERDATSTEFVSTYITDIFGN